MHLHNFLSLCKLFSEVFLMIPFIFVLNTWRVCGWLGKGGGGVRHTCKYSKSKSFYEFSSELFQRLIFNELDTLPDCSVLIYEWCSRNITPPDRLIHPVPWPRQFPISPIYKQSFESSLFPHFFGTTLWVFIVVDHPLYRAWPAPWKRPPFDGIHSGLIQMEDTWGALAGSTASFLSTPHHLCTSS